MAVCRVERTGDYTTMSNHHLRNKGISLKAKGLLSVMLSLPDNWDYTIRGLSVINKEGLDSIRSTIQELELAGYVERQRTRDAHGRFHTSEYIIREMHVSPVSGIPAPDIPTQANPMPETPTQISKEVIRKDQSNTDSSITQSFLQEQSEEGQNGNAQRDRIKKQIEYNCMVQRYSSCQLDEWVEIMLEVALNKSQTIRIGRDQEYPRDYVQERFSKITASHIERIMDGIADNQVPVHNTKAYLLAVLFNSVSTIDHYYTIQANADAATRRRPEKHGDRFVRDYSFAPGDSL